MRTLNDLQTRCYKLCFACQKELTVGEFAPVKFDDTEKRELTETIEHILLSIGEASRYDAKKRRERYNELLETLLIGLDYIRSESFPLGEVPLRWITTRDAEYAITERKA